MTDRVFGAALLASLAVGGCKAASPAPTETLTEAERAAIADTVRQVSNQMLEAMRARAVDEVLAFYGRTTAYVGSGAIGDWPAIVAGAPPRYGTYAKVDCVWDEPFRIDVLARNAAVVTAVLDCQKADTAGRAWRERAARTEVLAPEDGRWRIVAVHESTVPGESELR